MSAQAVPTPAEETAPTSAERPGSSLTQRQLLFWLGQKRNPGVPLYNMIVEFEMRGELDVAKFQCAFADLVGSCDALRSIFVEANGTAHQVVAPVEFPLPFEDLSGHEDAADEFRRRTESRNAQVFDLSRRCFDSALFRLGPSHYVWWLCQHHLIGDGASIGLMYRFLAERYCGEAKLTLGSAREVELQERAYLGSPRSATDEAFWAPRREHVLERAPFYAHPKIEPGKHVRRLEARLDHETSSRIRAIAKSAGIAALPDLAVVSLFKTVLFAYLYRITGRSEQAIGAPFRNRHTRAAKNAVGCFIEVAPVQANVEAQDTFRTLFTRVQDDLLAVLRHSQSCISNSDQQPLFDLTFNFLSEKYAPFAGLPTRVSFTTGMHAFDALSSSPPTYIAGGESLSINCQDYLSEGRYTLWFDFNAARFDTDQQERTVAHVLKLLHAALENPDAPIATVDVVTTDERERLLRRFNPTPELDEREPTVVELFEAQVRRTPHRECVRFGEDTLSYGELGARAERLAAELRAMGVGASQLVGVLLRRSLQVPVALLGVLRAGGAYVPLDPSHPSTRNALVLEDAHPRVILTERALLGLVTPPPGADIVCLDELDWDRPTTEPLEPPRPDDLAYVLFTSGSSGRPKGVAIPHSALANFLQSMRDKPGMAPSDRALALTTIAFDIAALELYLPLATGAQIELVGSETATDPNKLAQLIERRRPTLVQATPATWQMLLDAGWSGDPGIKALCGGEALSPDLAASLARRVGELWNMYGPTETTVWSTVERIDPELPTPVTIGTPIRNTTVYILNDALQLAPIGVPGEICIGGAGLAQGYYEKPELTESRFVFDPFQGDGARMYRTGDLGLWRSDGRLECLGRADFQVKIRGFRIELGEIESVLGRHHKVRAAVVVAREFSASEKRLVAYVVVHDEPVSVGELREHVRANLPEYMVPSAFVFLPSLPLTPNGKVDRKALPAPEYDASQHEAYEAPVGEVESRMAAIWCDVLGVARVGRHDNFFELGGHSLLAIKLIQRLRQATMEVDVGALFAVPTVAGLASSLDGARSSLKTPENGIPAGCSAITPDMLPLVQLSQDDIDRIVAAVPGGASNVEDIYPLGPLQEGILFHHMMATEGDAYVLSSLTSFQTREQLDRYLSALQSVIARHEVLRSAIIWEGLPEPVQVVHRRVDLPVEELAIDSARLDVATELQARFDSTRFRLELTQAPLTRAYIAFDAAKGRWLLLLLLHHLVSDHTALHWMDAEASAILAGNGESLPKPTPYRNFVAQARLGVSRQEHEAFFRSLLGDVSEPTLPFGMHEVHGTGADMVTTRRELDGHLAARLRERARKLGVSAASLCHLAWALVLARVTGRDDVVFGTVLFGRMQGGDGADRSLGLFINTLPLRVRLGDESLVEVARRTHASLAELMVHEHASLALAQRCSGVAAPAPLFSALLNYRHESPEVLGATPDGSNGLGTERTFAEERTNYPLTASVHDLGSGFAISAQVQLPVSSERICEFLHTAIETIVDVLETNAASSVRKLDILPGPERHRLVHEFNPTFVEREPGENILVLFATQARRHPHKVAARFHGEAVTYAELDAQSSAIAAELRRRGVGRDVLVGVLLRRSLHVPAALLGVLKAGGAYVPLDPSHPSVRNALVMEDAKPAVVLTERTLLQRVTIPETAQAICIEEIGPELDLSLEASVPDPEDLAYVLFTSGSTGRPKGVAIPHRALANFLVSMRAKPGMSDRDRVLAITTVAFDIAVLELLLPVATGATIELVDAETAGDPILLSQLIAEWRPTVAQATPATWQMLLEIGWKGDPELKALCGGEALSPELANRLAPRVGQLWNMYGPTETTVWSTLELIDRAQPTPITIGTPIRNTVVRILNDALQLAPIGVPGEICIGGDGVATGYYQNPELTQARFIPDTFSGRAGRLYRTGDLGVWRQDGRLECLGRADFQVKIRGYRIELGEIESVLLAYRGVASAVVVAREDRPGDKQLAGYLVPRAGATLDRAEARTFIQERLPSYMVPAALVVLESLPLTPNGKVDRKALPRPDFEAKKAKSEPPQTDMELRVAAIFEKLLGISVIGRNDNFFELGGQSLLAAQLLVRLNQIAKNSVSIGQIFQRPTVAELAELVAQGGPSDEPLVIPLNRANSGTPLFCVCGIHLYSELAQALGSTHPVYGVYLPAEEKGIAAARTQGRIFSVQELAAGYLEAVRKQQPKGPYCLAGVSFGGILAYEMAQQLLRSGEEVSLLALFDSALPRALHRRWFRWVRAHVGAAVRKRSLAYVVDRVKRLAKEYRMRSGVTPGQELPVDWEFRLSVYLEATRRYDAAIQPYPGRMMLFRASAREVFEGYDVEPALGWAQLVRSIELYEAQGSHLGIMLEPGVRMLAEPMRRALETLARSRQTSDAQPRAEIPL